MPKFVLWIGVAFLVAGVAMLGGAGWAESDARGFEATGVRAPGTVIDFAEQRSKDDGRTS